MPPLAAFRVMTPLLKMDDSSRLEDTWTCYFHPWAAPRPRRRTGAGASCCTSDAALASFTAEKHPDRALAAMRLNVENTRNEARFLRADVTRSYWLAAQRRLDRERPSAIGHVLQQWNGARTVSG